MTIRAKILLIVASWAVLALLVSGFVLLLNRQLAVENERIALTNGLINDIFELNILTNDYLLNGEERAELQWYTKHETINNTLAGDSLVALSEFQTSVEKLSRNAETSKNIFDQLVRSTADEGGGQVEEDFQDRLVGQLSRASQDMVSESFLLSETSQDEIDRLRQRIVLAHVAFLLSVLFLASAGGYVMLRGVAGPVAELARAKAKDEAILGSIGEALVVTDQAGVVTLTNETFQKIVAISKDDALGKKFVDLVKAVQGKEGEEKPIEESKRLEMLALSTAKAQRCHLGDNISFVQANGDLVPVVISVSPILLKGEPIGAAIVFRDSTQEKSVDKAKSEFVSLASHQLQAPLTAANWNIEMLLEGDAGKLTEEQKKLFVEIKDSNVRMKDLVQALLNASRIDLGTFKVEPEETDLQEMSESLLHEFSARTKEKNLTVTTDFSSQVPHLMVDPSLMRIVVQNIVSNAIKYTPADGTVSLKLQVASTGDEVKGTKLQKESVLFEISDTGMGIPEDEQDKMFSKMYRASNVKDVASGTGLGLYMVQSIIKLAEGQIWFNSEEGKGTTFYIAIPTQGMKKREGSKALTSVVA